MVDYVTEIPLPGRATFGRLDSPALAAAQRGSGRGMATFIAGPENRLVADTLMRLLQSSPFAAADNGTRRVPTLLVLYGPSGTGKTHLARGLAHYWQRQRGPESACYVTAADFRREFIAAVDRNSIVEFRRQHRERQLLAIDDLHQLPNDSPIVQELRATLDAYGESGDTIIVTSPRPAHTLANLPPDVRSRLAAGLALQLAAPETAARLRIIRQGCAALGRTLSDDAARRLAAGLSGTAADLFGALFELCAAPAGALSDSARAERLLAARTARRPTLRNVIAVVAKHNRLPQRQLKSGSRRQAAVTARGMVAHLARELTDASYEEIGRTLGGRDHTTIMHCYRTMDQKQRRDPAIRETLDELRRVLLSR